MSFEAIPKVAKDNQLEVLEKIKRNIELLTGVNVNGDRNLRAVLNRDIVGAGLAQFGRSNQIVAPAVALGGIDIIHSGSLSGAAQYDSPSFTSDYRMYLFVFDDLLPATDNVEARLRFFNAAGEAAGASDYAWSNDRVTEAGASTLAGDNADSEITLAAGIGNAAAESMSGSITVYNPISDGSLTSVNWQAVYSGEDGVTRSLFGAGQRLVAEANNAMRLIFSSGDIATMNYTLYGFKK